MGVAALLAACSLLGGCARGRVVVVETVPATSVTTRVDSSVLPAPRLEAMPVVGMRLSFPEAVRRYETRLKELAVLEVVEIEFGDGRAVVRTPLGETVHRLPPVGETKTIRPGSDGAVREYVAGEPEKERMEVVFPEQPTIWDRLGRTILVIVLLLGLILVLGLGAWVREKVNLT